MKFVIQHNLINAQSLEKIRRATGHLPVVWVGAIPFTEEIAANEDLGGLNYIPYGSNLLARVAAKRGWKGLHHDLTKLNYHNFVEHRSDMVNDQIQTAKELVFFLENNQDRWHKEYFIRPSLDDKQFSGTVMEPKEIIEWFKSMMESGPGSYYMAPETDIVINTPKTIQAEWRWFIVGGKVISGSMYRAHDQMNLQQELDTAVIEEAQRLADVWLPCDCVVMDTALVDDEVKVLEFNNINSSGFYDHDIKSVFNALFDYHTKTML
jgi:hypothetical protein